VDTLKDYWFVVISDHPVHRGEVFQLNYWDVAGPGEIGKPPPPTATIDVEVTDPNQFPQKYQLIRTGRTSRLSRLTEEQNMKFPYMRSFWLVCFSLLACLAATSPNNRSESEVTEGIYSQATHANRNSFEWRRDLYILKAQYYPTVRCIIPQGVCYLQGSTPPGYPCWCATVYGPVAGRVR